MTRFLSFLMLMPGALALSGQTEPPCNPYDNNYDGVIGVADVLGLLSVFGNSDLDFDGIWDDVDDCVLDVCDVCNGNGPQFYVLDSIFPVFDSVYVEQLSEWYVFEVGVDTVYSYQCEPNAPTLQLLSVGNVTSNGALFNAQIVDDGGDSIVSAGFQVSANSSFENSVSFEANLPEDDMDLISLEVSGLDANAMLYVRAFASNSGQTGFSDFLAFETLPPPIEVNAGNNQIGIQGNWTNLNNNACSSWLRTPVTGSAPPAGWLPSWTVVSGNNGCFSNPNATATDFIGRQGNVYTLRYTLTHQATGTQYWDEVQISFASFTQYSITRNGGTNQGTAYQYLRNDGYGSDVQYISNGETQWICAWTGSITFYAGGAGSGLEIVAIGSCY